MKNYIYGWKVKELAKKEVPVTEYTQSQWDMYEFVTGVLNNAIKATNCGWAGVTYKVMSIGNDTREYMVLYATGDVNGNFNGSRWIPVDGNNKDCNFSVLGENIW